MALPLKPEDLTVDTVVIGPEPEESFDGSIIWRTNTEPMPMSDTGCTACIA